MEGSQSYSKPTRTTYNLPFQLSNESRRSTNSASDNLGQDFPLIDEEDIETNLNSGPRTPAKMSPARPIRRSQPSTPKAKPIERNISDIDVKSSPINNKSLNLFNRQQKISENQELNKSNLLTVGSNSVQLPATPLTDPAKFGIPVRRSAKDVTSKSSGIKSRKSKLKEQVSGVESKSSSSDIIKLFLFSLVNMYKWIPVRTISLVM